MLSRRNARLFRFMKLTLLQKMVIVLDLLILLTLPFIAGGGFAGVQSSEKMLTEENLVHAKFAGYRDLDRDELSVEAVKAETHAALASEKEPETAQKVLVAGQSIGVGIVEAETALVEAVEEEVETVVNEIPKTLSDEAINFLGNCESGMNPTTNTGNGYYGAFQFSYGTWQSMGTEYERADLAPLEVQIDAVQRLVARSNIYGQFPACAQRMQSLGLI